MRTSDFDYDLPQASIAQQAMEPRDAARLMVLGRGAGPPGHLRFRDLGALLAPGDLLVLNDTKVIPARLFGERTATGGKVECLLTRELDPGIWEALVRSRGKPRPGETLALADGRLRARLEEKGAAGSWRLALEPAAVVWAVLEACGRVPLPPYIRRGEAGEAVHARDRERYQTVYAERAGAVAAPTAGLHFTGALLDRLRARGVELAHVTLHVGPGTFRPVTVDDPAEHIMHSERYEMPEATLAAISATRAAGGRVVACGTTTVRTLETVAATGRLSGDTDIFIRPPYRPRLTDALITNFHLPRSTLLMLVATFVGRERLLDAYREAIALGYRFYSYGDAMVIL